MKHAATWLFILSALRRVLEGLFTSHSSTVPAGCSRTMRCTHTCVPLPSGRSMYHDLFLKQRMTCMYVLEDVVSMYIQGISWCGCLHVPLAYSL